MSARDALLTTMIAQPQGLPAMGDLDAFWHRFDRTAPRHLRLAIHAATLWVGLLLPLVLHRRTLASLTSAQRQHVLTRAAALPGGADLLDIVKIVACMAAFHNDDARALTQGPA